MNRLKVIFAGTPEFAVPSLAALIASGFPPIAVYTQPDRPAGRGRKLQASPVKRLADKESIPILQPASLRRDPEAIARLQALDADLMVVVAYGLLLPPPVLEAPRLGCVNVHASLLPRWRGAAPIQRALLAGDDRTGICIMAMEAGLDTGPVYHRVTTPIAARETGASLHDRLATLGAQALIDALPGIIDGSRLPEPQDEGEATYAHKIAKEEALIDWSQPAQAIERQVRAFNPWPVAQTRLDEAALRIWDAEADPAVTTMAPPGSVIAADRSGIAVATASGALRVTLLQPPGRRPMSAADFLNARHLDGVRLG